jgi:hypothetical protein
VQRIFPPEHPIFSLAAQMRMRYQAVDHEGATLWSDSVVFKYINISDVNIKIYAIYKLMLCITGIQSSTDYLDGIFITQRQSWEGARQ